MPRFSRRGAAWGRVAEDELCVIAKTRYGIRRRRDCVSQVRLNLASGRPPGYRQGWKYRAGSPVTTNSGAATSAAKTLCVAYEAKYTRRDSYESGVSIGYPLNSTRGGHCPAQDNAPRPMCYARQESPRRTRRGGYSLTRPAARDHIAAYTTGRNIESHAYASQGGPSTYWLYVSAPGRRPEIGQSA